MAKLLISGCLLGQKVRYDGEGKLVMHPGLQALIDAGEVVSICPEVAGGLPIPRPAAEIQGEGGGVGVWQKIAVIQTKAFVDVTSEFIQGAKKTLELAQLHNIKVAILKARSPSCGSSQIYDGSFQGKVIDGMGATAALLTEHGISVFNEEQIDSALAALN